jgi:hypothetical protein
VTTGIVAQTNATTFAPRTLTGTSNRVTITNGDGVSGNPTFDISSSYVGQATITTVGTITTGTWSGLFGAVTGANLTNLTAANISAGTAGINITGNAATVTTNANLTGAITSSGNATSLGSFTSAQLLGALTDETGSGANVFATSPTLVTPLLGTPTSGVLTNCTGLPMTTGVTGILAGTNGGTGVNNGANTITIAGNVTHAGAFTQSFTATGNTAVTLPTSGTLIGSADTGTVTSTMLASVAATHDKIGTDVRKMLNTVQDFRLTLTSGTPVTTSDVTGATTIYCTPYKGSSIALYDGTNWNIRTSAEFSIALGTLTSGKPYDVFCYDNAGTPTLEILAWTNDTTRAGGGIVYQGGNSAGVYFKFGDPTRRYMGTFYTTSTTTTEDSAQNRYLWNYYNRVPRAMRRVDATASWTYTTATIRQANASTSNQLNFVLGRSEDVVDVTVKAQASNSTGGASLTTGIGIDTTSANTDIFFSTFSTGGAGTSVTNSARHCALVAEGRHYACWTESSSVTGTTTWVGSGTSGIYGSLMG